MTQTAATSTTITLVKNALDTAASVVTVIETRLPSGFYDPFANWPIVPQLNRAQRRLEQRHKRNRTPKGVSHAY